MLGYYWVNDVEQFRHLNSGDILPAAAKTDLPVLFVEDHVKVGSFVSRGSARHKVVEVLSGR